MTIFSHDQMYRPLFEEPTSDIERMDAWEGPFGFLIGGMANMSLQDLAEQYFDAAFLLSETVRKGEREDYRLANPTLFLYRHSIELLLKSAMGEAAKTHSLEKLADDFVALVKHKLNKDVAYWIITRIKELFNVDPGSTAFRYSMNRDKTTTLFAERLHVRSDKTKTHRFLPKPLSENLPPLFFRKLYFIVALEAVPVTNNLPM